LFVVHKKEADRFHHVGSIGPGTVASNPTGAGEACALAGEPLPPP
jgi:hypothetical protein